MTKSQKVSLFLLRLTTGWLFFYAGITKLLDPEWSSVGYLKGAKSFAGLFGTLTSPGVLPVVDFLNKWGLTLVGLSLILGVFVRLSSIFGAILMALYYLPLSFPMPDTHSYIVDYHIIYLFALVVLGVWKAGRAWGFENWCSNLPICSKYPKLRGLLG